MTVDFSGVLDSDSEFLLEVDENIADILLWKGQLGLRSLSLTGHVQSQTLF